MNQTLADKYYSRPEIQKAILDFAKDREIAVQFKSSYFGKRPDTIEYISDVKSFVQKEASSFHCSEERWANPLLLGNEKYSEEEKVKNRIGWDLILDLDGVDFFYAQIVGKIIIEFLNEIGVHNASTKFSGNKGFHIGIPFEAFSKNIIGIGETRKLFPVVARKIAAYLMVELKGRISKAILEHDGSVEKIAKKYDLDVNDLINDDIDSYNFEFMKVIEIDTILISSRHLFRMPYSLNEKSGLASVPLKNENIMKFEKNWAKVGNVKPEFNKHFEFLRYDPKYGKDGDILLMRTYEDGNDDEFEKIVNKIKKDKKGHERGIIFEGEFEIAAFEIDEKVELKDFPATIVFALENDFEDGKKRALFLLLTFLHAVKWDKDHIRATIDEWNSKQSSPLKKNYINAQITWFENQEKTISPPNYNNQNYYRGIGIDEEIIKEDKDKFPRVNVKNPLHYIYLFVKSKNSKEKKN
ncbi:MAG: hypothetical protein PF569_03330 [Candidatus Woesearchaeota archaeon]|jgi:hypothetical protein|nr:hypothetical protein [Candidatus Woesearchaeota archaeon]